MEKVRTLYFANFKSSKSKCGVIFSNFSPVAEIYVISHFDNISVFCFLRSIPKADGKDLKFGFGHSSCATNHIDNSFSVK